MAAHERVNVMCFCEACDEEVAGKIEGEDYCDCDLYERWVCHKCVKGKEDEERWYLRERTDSTCRGDYEGEEA